MPAAWVAAAGAIIGGLSSMQDSGGGTTTTTQNNDPWYGQQKYLEDIFAQANQQYKGKPAEYYPGKTVADQSPFTQAAIARMAGSGLDPNSLTQKSLGEFGKTVQGDYLKADSNPYLKQTVDDALGQVQGKVAGLYGSRGGNNYGSSAHEEFLTRNLASTALPIYAQNYQQERARQLNAAQIGPSMEAAGSQGLSQAGAATDVYQQALIEADKARHDFAQNSPWDQLQRYQSAISGNYGGFQSSTNPYFKPNTALNALGGAATGLGMYNQYQQANKNKSTNAGTTGGSVFAGDSGWNNTGDYNSGGYENGGWGYA